MQLRGRLAAAAIAAAISVKPCLAQEPQMIKHAKTGITFGTWTTSISQYDSAYQFGMALPEDALTKDSNEYIGLLKCAINNATSSGWCGLSHGESGQMVGALLLMAWPHEGQVLTSFRYASGYDFPGVYTGDAKLTQISSTITADSFELVYRCQNCLSWNEGGETGKVSTSQGFLILGRAAGSETPGNAGCPDKITFGFHNTGFGQYGAVLTGLVSPSYKTWAALEAKTVTGSCGGAAPVQPPAPEPTDDDACEDERATTTSGTTIRSTTVTSLTTVTSASTTVSSGTPTTASRVTFTPAPTASYDYIVVGAGAGGIPVADKLSEAGFSVLLIEKGPVSSGRWGGRMGPEWLNGTNLTRFDVPGLCNQIWVDALGVACTDMDQMAGCVLGGGTAVNAGLWWKPNPLDWDVQFPVGWKSSDTKGATDRVFSRIPGTTHPSQDGKLYYDEGFNALATGFELNGWTRLENPNSAPEKKNKVYGHTVFMFEGGERGGPMATYLKTASGRNKFRLITDTAVKRVLRTGGQITGVELEGNTETGMGYEGVVSVTKGTGRVILSAGVFGTSKILFRSGIGPNDALTIVKGSSDGASMIGQESWISLPVGYNLVDHVNTDAIVEHPTVKFYDFYEAWDTPIATDEEKYLKNRTGILAQAAPNIGPMFWHEIVGKDGITRQLQWTARVEGTTNESMTLSQYLGRGSTSRGRLSITTRLDTRVVTPPYLHDENDKLAVIEGLDTIRAALSKIPNLTWHVPPTNVTSKDYVDSLLTTPAQRRANHWMGTAKMGTDDGRKDNGTAVVDLNTKVYGTDNLFVVDASIFPGMVTGNPSAMIIIAAEHAATKILALKPAGAQKKRSRFMALS